MQLLQRNHPGADGWGMWLQYLSDLIIIGGDGQAHVNVRQGSKQVQVPAHQGRPGQDGNPPAMAPLTLEALAETGVSVAGLRSKGLEEIEFSAYYLAVNLTNYSLKNLLPLTFRGRLLHRPVFDPYGGSLEDYRRTRDILYGLITQEIYAILHLAGTAPYL